MNSIKVFAPASVANVCVGFDAMGFALDRPGDEVVIREGREKGLKITQITGAKNKLPLDIHKNTAGFAAYKLLEHINELDRPLEMEIHKKLPFNSGLGSSAASAVAGVFAVNEFCKTGLNKYDLLPFAVDGEALASGSRHADNVAPSLLGGLVLVRDTATSDIKKIHVPVGLNVVVIYPHISIPTVEARNILSKEVNFRDAISQAANMGAFVAAMYTSDFGLIKRSLHDSLVEHQRAKLIPHFYDIKQIAIEEGCLGTSISGAGPSIFALCDNTSIAENIGEKAAQLYKNAKIEVDVFYSKINLEGAYRY